MDFSYKKGNDGNINDVLYSGSNASNNGLNSNSNSLQGNSSGTLGGATNAEDKVAMLQRIKE